MQTPTVTINDVERWNDTFAREFDIDEFYERSGFAIRWIERQRLMCIRKMIAATPDDRILEVGCGGGHVLQLFPDSDLTGVDVSGEMLRKARRNLKGYRIQLHHGELQDLDLPAEGFSKIICTEVLEHVVDPDVMLEQMRRLLRPEGRMVITFPNDSLVNALKLILRRSGLTILPPLRRISWGGDRYHLHHWRLGEMRELVSRYFQIRRSRFSPARVLPIRYCFECGPQGQ